MRTLLSELTEVGFLPKYLDFGPGLVTVAAVVGRISGVIGGRGREERWDLFFFFLLPLARSRSGYVGIGSD